MSASLPTGAAAILRARGLLLFLLVLASGLGARAAAARADRLRVVCTIPDLADIVGEIGGDRVVTTTITKGRENLHRVTARPSHLIATSKADLFVQIGLSLEAAFVPGLLEAARNPRIAPGKPGFVNVSDGWTAIDVPVSVSRASGDVHPHGNPHMNLDPRAGRHIAAKVLAALVAVDPSATAEHERRHADYLARLSVTEARWAQLGSAWKGRRIVVYHQEYNHLARLYGLEIAGTIEVRPGIPPTPNHVASLVKEMRRERVAAILTAAWSNDGHTRQVSEATGVPIVELPNQCGGRRGAETWIAMIDSIHEQLAAVLRPPAPPAPR